LSLASWLVYEIAAGLALDSRRACLLLKKKASPI